MYITKKIVMKLLSFILLSSMLIFTACKKNGSAAVLQEPVPTGTKLSMGSFVSNAHTTTGMAKVIDSAGQKYLVFQNFSTDNGPALRVWLSKNTGVADYINLGNLKAASGNFYYPLAATHNTGVYTHVLVWCEAFSVLFGHAVLQ
jgi:Electron transfer DM13